MKFSPALMAIVLLGLVILGGACGEKGQVKTTATVTMEARATNTPTPTSTPTLTATPTATPLPEESPQAEAFYRQFMADRQRAQGGRRWDVDLTGDGRAETIFDTIGEDCGSCHGHMIFVFTGTDLLLEQEGDDVGAIRFHPEVHSFDVTQPVRLPGEPMCCPSQYETRTYSWDGLRFVSDGPGPRCLQADLGPDGACPLP